MYLLGVNFIINTIIGDLSDLKIAELKKQFVQFPEVQVQNPYNIILKNANQGIQIDSMNNIISYFFNGDSNDINFERVEAALVKVLDIFEKNYVANVAVTFQAINNKSFNVKEKSKAVFPDYSEIDTSIYGVGIRLLTSSDNFSGEVKVEPYIQDSNQVFVFGNSQSMEQIEVKKELFSSELDKMIQIAQQVDNQIFG